MRITHQAIVGQTILDMQRSLRALEETRSQVASGRRLSRPSDDPVEVSRALELRSRLTGVEQHVRNIDNALARLNQTESVLDGANEVLMQLRQLAVQFGTEPTINSRDRENAVEQIEQLKAQLIQLANTKVAGQFIFAGTQTNAPPYEDRDDRVLYNGNGDEIFVEIEDGQTVAVNLPGTRVFDTSANGIFQAVEDFKTALSQNDAETLREMIERIDAQTEAVLNGRATNAARTQRVEFSRERLFDDEINTTQTLSEVEDVDMAQAITEFANQQNAYQAALASSAKAIQPSLLSVLG